MALLDDPHESHIVFGTCNRNFTQYRRLRFWDEKVRLGIQMARTFTGKIVETHV
jgi:hypothetical protein